MKKEDIAKSIINQLSGSLEETKWINIKALDINNHYFNAEDSGELFSEGYISFGKKGTFIAIGKFDDRYYTDVDEFHSSYEYFISFGNGRQEISFDSKPKYVINSGLTVYRNRLNDTELSKKLIELYDQIVLSVINITDTDDFMKDFLGTN